MRTLVVTDFVSLDGVVQSVLSDGEDREGGFQHGGWAAALMDEEVAALMASVTTGAEAMVLGRKTYEGFASVWPSADDSEPAVAAMNRMPKHVASRTLTSLAWRNSHLLGPDLEGAVRALKAGGGGGEVAVFGSGDLVRTLAALGLVDRYRLLVFPVVLGGGKRLFADGFPHQHLRLASSTVTSSGVLVTEYEAAAPRRR